MPRHLSEQSTVPGQSNGTNRLRCAPSVLARCTLCSATPCFWTGKMRSWRRGGARFAPHKAFIFPHPPNCFQRVLRLCKPPISWGTVSVLTGSALWPTMCLGFVSKTDTPLRSAQGENGGHRLLRDNNQHGDSGKGKVVEGSGRGAWWVVRVYPVSWWRRFGRGRPPPGAPVSSFLGLPGVGSSGSVGAQGGRAAPRPCV